MIRQSTPRDCAIFTWRWAIPRWRAFHIARLCFTAGAADLAWWAGDGAWRDVEPLGPFASKGS